MSGALRALSGRPVAEITLDAVRAGEIGVADLRIHPETLERQAVIAQEHGNPQPAGNLRRAAELTGLGDEEVLSIYEALRPRRSTVAELTALAESLAARGLPLNAALIAEAAEVGTPGGTGACQGAASAAVMSAAPWRAVPGPPLRGGRRPGHYAGRGP